MRQADASPANYIETTGTLTNTTVSRPANALRRGIAIGNNSDTAMTVRVGGTASASAGLPIPAGTTLVLSNNIAPPSGAVSVFCAGTSKAYTIYEWFWPN